jgi:Cdc6-like AAA superfamily ATPase
MVNRIIEDSGILEEEYIPENILHRQKELAQLSNAINVVNTFVYGPCGSGKTLLINKTIENFNARTGGGSIYIDCCLYQTTNAILHEILLSLNCIVSSRSNYELTKRLKARLRNLDHDITICLDHFERLKEIETVNKILSLGMKLIIVSESYETYRRLNTMGKSNITNIIEIPGYTEDQAFGILLERARNSLKDTAYSEGTIRKIVQTSSCNITLSLNLLKALALKAENDGKNSIDEVECQYKFNCESQDLKTDERILVEILREQRRLASNALFGLYSLRARYPKSRRSFRNYMHNLSGLGLVRNAGDKRGRTYEIVHGIFDHASDGRTELRRRSKSSCRSNR